MQFKKTTAMILYSKGDIDVYDLNGNYLGNSSWETEENE